jgi:hypothetical protein
MFKVGGRGPEGVELRMKTPPCMRNGFARDPIRNHPRRVMTAATLGSEPENSLPGMMPTMPVHERDPVQGEIKHVQTTYDGR